MHSDEDCNNSLPPHTGLLREETVVLRHLLGYCDEVSLSPRMTELGVKLPNSPMRDVLLVGLDIDTFQGYEQIVPDQQFHVGVSILDTRRLADLAAASSLGNKPEPENSIIQSYQYTIGNSRYCRKASNRFLFGVSESVSLTELRLKLENLVSHNGRDKVLVLHGADSDLKVLRNLGIDLEHLYIIDTNKAAQFPLQLHYRYGLEKLLGVLGIPYEYLHAAGNDARFSLQALLMLAVMDGESQPHADDASREALIQSFRVVSQAPRPLTPSEMRGPFEQKLREAKMLSKATRKVRREARKERRRLERENQPEFVAIASLRKEA